MKRLAIALLIWLLAAIPTAAQSGTTIWLPVIYSTGNPCNEVGMSDWKIIIPQATSNMVLNSSGEITGNFAAAAGTTVTRVTTYQHYGLYSYRVESNANNEGIQLTLSALTNAIHYVTVRVRGTLPAAWDWSLDNATYTAPTLLEQIDSNWALYGLQFPAAQANGSTTLYIYQNGAGSGDYYLDGIQVEAKSTWTTYCDGTQPGCAWNGVAHASTSTRSAFSRAGGQVYDLETDYYLNVGGMSGTGTPPQSLGVDKYATLPGGELNSLKVDSRVFTLTGVITGTSQPDFHTRKQTLINALSSDAYPEDENGPQPVRLRYQGATVHKEIAVDYDGGLEGELSASDPCAWERVAVRFLADDPYWYEYGESAALLDTNDSATFRVIAGRTKANQQWSALGPPNAAGSYTDIQAIEYGPDGYVYFGGEFANFDNIAAADAIARMNISTGVYSALAALSGGTTRVHALAFGPDGTLYVGGEFLNAGGDAAADYLAKWDGAAFSAVSATVLNGVVRALAFAPNGDLYVGGDFTNVAADANADYVVKLVGTSYVTLGATPLNGLVRAITVARDGTVYIGGDFTNAGGDGNADFLCKWNGMAFSALTSTALGALVRALDINYATNVLYIGGDFTNAGGNANADYICSFNGVVFSPLGSGVNGAVYAIKVAPDSTVYASGAFTSAGGITNTERQARFNGYVWAALDLILSTSGTILAFETGGKDPVVPSSYDLFVGFDDTGVTGNYGGKTTVTNDGNVPAQPRFIVNRTGGTTATLETLRNETNGKELLYNYALLSGETLTTDLASTEQSVISSFFGDRPSAMLANSDSGSWVLLPGSNSVTSFVATAGAPTVTGHLLWKDRYKSQD